MRSSKAEIEKRRENIITYLLENGESNIEDIASYLSISTLTVRRDIEEFKANQIIGQKNGNLKLNDDFKLKLKQNKYSRERKAIQKEAAKHVEENDVLFINTSYTALGTVKYIKDIHCTIITNNTNIVNIERDKSIVALLTGGEIREPRSSIVGEIAYNTISQIKANKCIIGVDGISLESGLSSSVLHEASITELMLKCCTGECFVVASSERINKTDRFFCGSLDLVNTIITDNKVDMLAVYEFRRRGIEVIIVNPDKT